MPTSLTANQLVAYNLMRIRKTLGLSQEQAAERLRPYVGEWSKAVYSAAERSYHGKRVRQFTADDLIGLSLAFGVPIVYFFLPPKQDDRTVGSGADKTDVTGVISGTADVSWIHLFKLMLDGDYRASLLHRMLELPEDDRPAPGSHEALALAHLAANRASALDAGSAPYTPDDLRLQVAGDRPIARRQAEESS